MDWLADDRTVPCNLACPEEILVATDLADAERLVPYAITQAKLSGASLIFVHAIQREEITASKSGNAFPIERGQKSTSTRAALEDITRMVRAQGVACSTVVSTGPVADMVTEILHRSGAGRLIVGTHARQGVDKFLMGSVARKLLESVDVPVFIVGPQCKGGASGWSIRRILLASSSPSQTAPKTVVARAIAQHCKADLTILYVAAAGGYTNRRAKPAHALAKPFQEMKGEGNGQSAFTRVADGDPSAEIVRFANEISADLIVLGVHLYPFRLPFGKETTAYQVLASAPCPVLTLKSDSARCATDR